MTVSPEKEFELVADIRYSNGYFVDNTALSSCIVMICCDFLQFNPKSPGAAFKLT
jgi:hypothetical protein